MAVQDRALIDEAYKWSIEAMYETDEAWEKEYLAVRSILQDDPFVDFRGHLADGAERVSQFLKVNLEVTERLQRLHVYAHMKADQDTRVASAQSMNSRASTLFAQYGERVSFFIPEMLALPEETWAAFLADERLADERHALDDLRRQKAHTLSAETEGVLASLSDALSGPGQAFRQFSNADFDFGSFEVDGTVYPVSEGSYGVYMRNKDRRVRHEAYAKLFDTYMAHKNGIATLYAANVKRNVTMAHVRGFASARHASLHRNNIPVSVYDSLIEGVHRGLSHLHRYTDLRARVLGLEKMAHYDRTVSLAEADLSGYDYEKGFAMIRAGLAPLGEEYQEILERAKTERWVDVYENKGKRSGAYSTGFYGTRPYILMNYQDDYNSVSTLAHELGHSVHTYLSSRHQLPQYSDYSIFLAEIASTVNETLLVNHLLRETSDPQVKAALLDQQIETIMGTIFRQTQFAEYEQKAHQAVESGEALTHESLSKLFGELAQQYYGPRYDLDERAAYEWARIPHFYNEFYVFQYATGLSAALVFADRMLKREPGAVDAYLGFLKSGSSAYPLDVLKRAGLDMTDPSIVQRAMEIFGGLVGELEGALEASKVL